MSNVDRNVRIPDWMDDLIRKKKNMQRSLLIFIGVLRKRFAVSGGGTEHIQGRLPRDVTVLLSHFSWKTRLDPRWVSIL